MHRLACCFPCAFSTFLAVDKTELQIGSTRQRLFYTYRWYVGMCWWNVCFFSFCFVSLLLLWWFSRKVGNQCSNGTDVRYDSKHNGEDREPQSLARRCIGPLEIPLSRCLVGLRNGGERRSEIKIRGGGKRREKGIRHHLSTSSLVSTFLVHSFQSHTKPILCSISE